MEKLKILFLCTGNSCRSQMAEGWTRNLKGDVIDVWSAGIKPKDVDPRAIKVMKEAGVDISGQKSKHVSELMDIRFDYVITVCDNVVEQCPFFPGKTTRIHVGFNDPPKLAENAKNEEEALEYYRRVRDEIKDFVMKMPEILYEKTNNQSINGETR
jgi:arsenate reductase (thioredoxin)